MFKFMECRDSALKEAHEFAISKLPDMNSDVPGKILSSYTVFPCLIEWFININWRNNPILDYNICRKPDAKCLVYPNTNKSTALSQTVLRSDIDIQKAMRKLGMASWRHAKVVKASEFNKVLKARKTPDEPFFVKARLIRKDHGDSNYIRISAINLKMAKHLVYYHKNNVQKFYSVEPRLFELAEAEEGPEVIVESTDYMEIAHLIAQKIGR